MTSALEGTPDNPFPPAGPNCDAPGNFIDPVFGRTDKPVQIPAPVDTSPPTAPPPVTVPPSAPPPTTAPPTPTPPTPPSLPGGGGPHGGGQWGDAPPAPGRLAP